MFSIITPPPTFGYIPVTWDIPIYRDTPPGEPLQPLSLAEIGNYTMYVTNPLTGDVYELNIPDAQSQALTVTDLPFGTYDIIMTTTDTDGRTSRDSDLVTKIAE